MTKPLNQIYVSMKTTIKYNHSQRFKENKADSDFPKIKYKEYNDQMLYSSPTHN